MIDTSPFLQSYMFDNTRPSWRVLSLWDVAMSCLRHFISRMALVTFS